MRQPPQRGADERIRVEVKRELRKRMRAVRGALPMSACEARSANIAERVLELPAFTAASTVLAFASIRREVRTDGILTAAWQASKRVALPRVVGEHLTLALVDADTPLDVGAFGVPEPAPNLPEAAPGTIDFALVPALAVDPEGYRIGYGGGYYDRLLPTLSRAFTCAVAFDFQLIGEVPRLPSDVSVDAVVTDARVIEIG
ncbi:MAG: 5-formyltetrahydrofolate cyclo-ligase [Myxococcota bacterium]